MSAKKSIAIRLFVVGCYGVGKSSLLHTYVHHKFPNQQLEVFESQPIEVDIDGRRVELTLRDRPKPLEYGPIREATYPNADGFIVVFSIVDPSTFIQAVKRWHPELKYKTSNTKPIVIVGNKSDLRAQYSSKDLSPKNAPVSTQRALKVIEEQLGSKYIECSALTQYNLNLVFQQAIKAALACKLQQKKKSCQLI